MRHVLVIAFLMTMTVPAAADEPKADPKVEPKKSEQVNKAFGSGTKKSQTPPPAKPPPLTPEQAAKLAVKNAKAAFVAAVAACERPGVCDPKSPAASRDSITLLKQKDEEFSRACKACASPEKCEAERGQILEGSSRYGSNPCDAR